MKIIKDSHGNIYKLGWFSLKGPYNRGLFQSLYSIKRSEVKKIFLTNVSPLSIKYKSDGKKYFGSAEPILERNFSFSVRIGCKKFEGDESLKLYRWAVGE